MNRRLYQLTSTLIVTLVVIAPISAGPSVGTQLAKVKRINLKCEIVSSGEFVDMRITNTSASTIPKGTTIHWTLNPQTKGSFKLQNALFQNQSITFAVEPHGYLSPPYEAWFWKSLS